ncbi:MULTISPECIES: hypothetical protein [Pseudomonas]|uniref:Uncharacterized protein n=1 Tax=Pseudomonas zeae TaxID=2745510 RepID=A0A9E6NNH3_9PSED|nr:MULTISPECIES: hypothetical protein [Pseudomonas]QXI10919.1 hypothetical protein HU754_024450 [Pseudomonas zeae]WGT34684.1 hypothetical protein QG303_03750 [Pseudomonas atacamensis]
MKRNYCPFKGPFHDSYSIGFQLYAQGGINWRHRTIAGVSWNGEEKEAFFFNPDGLVLPLTPNPWELPEIIRKHAVRREFSSIHGHGHFAMKEGRRAGLSQFALNNWVTYWLIDQKDGYSNDSDVWGKFVDKEIEQEKGISERLYTDLRITSDLSEYMEGCLNERRNVLAEQHRRRYAEDRKILAWLKGDTPPPLFANVQEAA